LAVGARSCESQERAGREVLNETADELATRARQSQNPTKMHNDHWLEQTVSIIGPRGRMCGRVARE
jgi:hypothetical protein